MSYDKNQALLEALKEFSDPKYREGINKTFEEIEKLDRDLAIIVVQVKQIAAYESDKNMEKAAKLYDSVFVKTGFLKTHQALSEHEIHKILDRKGFARLFIIRLEMAQAFIRYSIAPCQKAIDIYGKIAKYTSTGIKFGSIAQMRDMAESAEEYRKYFKELGEEFSTAIAVMDGIADRLPFGASTYCKFISGAAGKCKVAFEIVSNYAEKINTLATEACDELAKAVGTKKVNAMTGIFVQKMQRGTDNQKLDIAF